MTSKRTYRNALPLEVVKSEIERCAGTQFDPKIAKTFLDILNNNYNEIEKFKHNINNTKKKLLYNNNFFFLCNI